MKILITGAYGFLGKNLIARLNEYKGKYTIYSYDLDTPFSDLERYTADCDFVFNFAAVHRPKDASEFEKVNHVFFDDLLDLLKNHNNRCPVLYTSSIQATNGTDYGNSKLAAEADLKAYGAETGARAIVYRLSNVYGRWATPNHHSVVATFCNNLALELPITVNDTNHMMYFHYIDDVIDSFVTQIEGTATPDDDGIFRVRKTHQITLGQLADTLISFQATVKEGQKPDLKNETQKTLYTTYLSYVEQNKNI
ncbi:MAG: NAD-dependent epimerase/dehydratase family protein [Ruminococcaceae bacterium]|nr:NAD-dependent epimerase/dehydratase family protein [Oscillospiraceae bacterium]MBE6707193.1 NAD-dependent epimerase/dehydratase family protein [Oscillospiraceae bacterium]